MRIRQYELKRLRAIENLEELEEQYDERLFNATELMEIEHVNSKDPKLSTVDKRKRAALQSLRHDISFMAISKAIKELKHNIAISRIEIEAMKRMHERTCYEVIR